MNTHTRNLMLSAGLSCLLALGTVGCTSSSTTTVTTEVTDENGTTTKETTTTTDQSGTTTTTTQTTTETAEEGIAYTNEGFGFAASIPDTFKQTEPTAENAGEETVLYAVDEDSECSLFIKTRDLSVDPAFEGPNPWAEHYAELLQSTLTKANQKITKCEVAEGSFAGVPCIMVESQSENEDGYESYRDYFFMVADTDEGPMGLYIGVMAPSEEALNIVENYFYSMEK